MLVLDNLAFDDPGYCIGIDIGGANLKLADTAGNANEQAFPLWKKPSELADAIAQLLAPFPVDSTLAVTMTGELADCYLDAAIGVQSIASATMQAANGLGVQEPSAGRVAAAVARKVLFYGVDGKFAGLDQVVSTPDRFAASNWHALALFLAQSVTESTLLVDVGSTTCDLIPLLPGEVGTRSQSDFDRLLAAELVYLGIGRTPVCSLVDHFPVRGKRVAVMNEFFASTDDCAILLDWVDESPEDCDTADGRGRTKEHARGRMAKMVGLDRRFFSLEEAAECSRYVFQQVRKRLDAAIEQSPPHTARIYSGHGQQLVSEPLLGSCSDDRWDAIPFRDLRDDWGAALSRVAPAYAVACLAGNQK
ncbi:hypothetical protein FF011L_17940 [Roseimaritima multifibrata]|uniref:Hydantoinase A/oxoprolinase domain-containing protein n=1 Tax=Roseimaritima multifibrata TaxID=1930274 RepID=A0A517MDS5_9BACT|nr:hydantoinase/oxoprolinase family protein [Roseimaritima multifibrata]QDS93039.1 hypothetical protein FF011L_17940 [Roseimaritima multifibrata]